MFLYQVQKSNSRPNVQHALLTYMRMEYFSCEYPLGGRNVIYYGKPCGAQNIYIIVMKGLHVYVASWVTVVWTAGKNGMYVCIHILNFKSKTQEFCRLETDTEQNLKRYCNGVWEAHMNKVG